MIILNTKVIRSTLDALHKGKRYIIQQGGTSSGKTYGIMTALVMWAKDQKEKKTITVMGQTVPHLTRGAYRDFEEIISEAGGLGAANKSQKIFHIGNCIMEFLAIDKLGKAKGGKRDILFVNECNEINYKIYQQLEIRTSQTIILDFNPSSEFWLHDTLLPSLSEQEYIFKRTTFKDNPTIDENIVRTLETYKETDENLWRVYGLGLTGTQQGLIFDNVTYIDRFPEYVKHEGYGMDFGYSNDPTTLVRCGVKGNNLYLQELLYKPGLTKDEIVQEMRKLRIPPSAEIFADKSEDRLVSEIAGEGFNIIRALRATSINHGIDTLKRYKIHITKDSLNFRKEQKNYRWAEKQGTPLNKPVDAFNHLWDATRYYSEYKLTSGISNLNPQGYSNRELAAMQRR